MKKIISVLLCLMLCTITAFAENSEKPETVGGKITLTQFLGVSREDAESVAITITMNDADFETVYVDKNAFYDISDNYMLTSAFEPEPITQEGVYITIEKTDGSLAYAYIEKWGFADKYSLLMSRLPYSLYKSDDILKINDIITLAKPKIIVNENLDITINGRKADFTLKPFVDENDRTLVPAREFCGFIRKSIVWSENPPHIAINPHSDTTLESGGNLGDSVIFRIGEKNYEINGGLYETDTAAQLIDGHAYIPLRTLAEFLGYSISFIPSSNL